MGLDLLGLTKNMTLKHVLGVVYMAFLVAIFRENTAVASLHVTRDRHTETTGIC